MTPRFPRLATLLAAALAVTALPAVAQANEEAPVLWEGVVKTPAGDPASNASVVAYARPPADRLEVGVPLAEVARTTADDDGRFTLRAPGGRAMAAAADSGGWTSVMVVATSPAGNSLAVDSLAWQPHEGIRGFSATAGRWITDPADLVAEAGASAVQTKLRDQSIERPAALVLSAARQGTVRPFASPSKAPGSFCMLTGQKGLGKRPVTVGHMHMERDWSGHFVYTNTKSTSFEIGVSMDGGTFTGRGSRTVTTEAEAGGDDLQHDTSRRRNRWYQIAMTFHRFDWRCNEFSGSFEAKTIEPGTWGGTNDYYDNDRLPGCDAQYQEWLGAHRFFRRKKGSGTVYAAGFNAGGFSGSTSVATSNTVSQLWSNDADRKRRLCGSTAPPTQYTFVRTEA